MSAPKRKYISASVLSSLHCVYDSIEAKVTLHLSHIIQRHLVDLILCDSLAYRDEQAWVEYRLVGELMQSTKVLHVGTLSDNLDGLGITQV